MKWNNFKKDLIFILSTIIILLLMRGVLHAATRLYFDEEYYVKTYPEIANLKISPFTHYASIGWKEGKNPNANIDNDFYINTHHGSDLNMEGLNPLEHSMFCKLSFEKCYTNPRQLKKAEALNNPQYYLTIVAPFRDEARFLKEWIEFHKLMGVEHFYLFNHLSKDNYMEVLKPYIDEGIVELNDIDIEPRNDEHWNEIQTDCYNRLIEKIKSKVEWLIVIDTDEFVYPVKDKDLKSPLKKYDSYASVSVYWKVFGSSNVEKLAKEQLLVEEIVFGSSYNHMFTTECALLGKCNPLVLDRHVKNIVKPRYVNNFDSPHFAKLKPGYMQINEKHEYFYGEFSPYQSRETIAINHYWARDLHFFHSSKLLRIHLIDSKLSSDDKVKMTNSLINRNINSSAERDDLILRFVPALKKHMFTRKLGG